MAIKREVLFGLLLSVAAFAILSLTAQQASAVSDFCAGESFPSPSYCASDGSCSIYSLSGSYQYCSQSGVDCSAHDGFYCSEPTDPATDDLGETSSCSSSNPCPGMKSACVNGVMEQVWAGNNLYPASCVTTCTGGWSCTTYSCSGTTRSCTAATGSTPTDCTGGSPSSTDLASLAQTCNNGCNVDNTCASPPACTAADCSVWNNDCSGGSQTCNTKDSTSSCTGTIPSRTCTVSCTSYPSTTTCSNGVSTTSYSSFPSPCTGTIPSSTQVSCSYGCANDGTCASAPTPPACTPTYATWSNYGSCLDSSNNAVTCGTGTETKTCQGTANSCGANYCTGSDSQSCQVTSECPTGCGWWDIFTGTSCNSGSTCQSGTCVPDVVCSPIVPPTNTTCINGQTTLVTTYTPNGCHANVVNTPACSATGQTGQTCAVNSDCASNSCSGSPKVCQAPLTTQITGSLWADMGGTAITNAGINDRVMMNVSGGHLNDAGKQVTFTWYKVGTSAPLGTATINAQAAGFASYNATITVSGSIYFTANVTPNTPVQSANLVVSSVQNNNPPTIVLTSPTLGGIYFANVPMLFSGTVTDRSSNITSTVWSFGDGATSNSLTGSHTYTSAGQKNVVLSVTNEKGIVATKKISVLVSASPGIYTYIDSPAQDSAIINNNLIAGYNAGQSYAINVVNTDGSPGCTTVVTCLAGVCPATTQQSPSCAAVKSIQLPVTGTPKGFDSLLFNWTFREGNKIIGSASTMNKPSGIQGFANTGLKNITLDLSYNSGSGANTISLRQAYSSTFYLFDQRQCSSDGGTWYNVVNGVIKYSVPTSSRCSGADGVAGTSDDCFPQGQNCTINGLQLDDSSKSCGDYTTQDSCNYDFTNRVRNGPLWSYYGCGSTNASGANILCNCTWIQPQVGTGSCQFSTNSRASTNPELTGAISSCSYATTSGACTNGYQQVTITASGLGCQSSTQTLPCGRPVVELPFVSSITIIGAVILIILIYFFVRPIKKVKRRR